MFINGYLIRMISLKEFQDTAIDALIKGVGELLAKDAPNKVCVFQSPTGSGKTVMLAKFIELAIKEFPDTDMCFVWVSIGKGELHKQSKRSLEKIFDGDPKCVLVEDEFFGSRTKIEQNEVVVVNWEKLRSKDNKSGEWKNKLMKDGEETNFIQVLQATKEKRKIILIIDESHYASDTKRTTELRDIVNADVTIEMSATPKIQPTPQELAKGTAKYIYVDPKDVIEEGMIKKEIIINEGIKNLVTDENTSQDVILEAAYHKRNELKKSFEAIGSEINPLCLIQLPNSEAGDSKREVIEAYLGGNGINEANGKLAVWLSGDKSDFIEDISQNDNEIEYLIFKQAIDTGWDCPRAHILVKLREIGSPTFEVQTVGRILRMPEQFHYEDESLNTGYIFTNLESITVAKEEYNPNIIKHLKAELRKGVENVELLSYYKSRIDFGDITTSFKNVLIKVFCEDLGIEINPTMVNIAENADQAKKHGVTIEFKTYKDKILTDKKLASEKLDDMEGKISNDDDETIDSKISDNDLQDVFNQVIKDNLNGFAPKRSMPTVRESIYVWFRKYLGINPRMENGAITIQNLFLYNTNRAKFTQMLSKATGEYKPIKKEEVKSKIAETFDLWSINKEEFYNQHTDEKTKYKLCIYEPCYLAIDRSTPEQDFEKHIETKGDKIEWWFKNGENKKDFFGIKYLENGLPKTFYPDFIIRYKSGRIGIFDTKEGHTAKDTGLKAEALSK